MTGAMLLPASWPSAGFQALPTPVGSAPFRATSSQLGIPAPVGGKRVLHVIGDTGGVMDPDPQKAVVKAMVADFLANPDVAFAYHVGDAGYFNGEVMAFMAQFFEAYENYKAPIIGVPGNHDGWPLPGSISLAEWMAVFCQPEPGHTLPGTEEFNRTAQAQPYCYWTLLDPAVTIIGCYSNVPSGGVIEADQAAWLEGELAAAPAGVPVIVAVHHPPLSHDEHHGSSPHVLALIDSAAKAADRWPDLVMSGHVHNRQRFTRTIAPCNDQGKLLYEKLIPYLVEGHGGYHNTHAMAPDAAPGLDLGGGVTLEAFSGMEVYGFTRLTIEAGKISGQSIDVTKDGQVTVGDTW